MSLTCQKNDFIKYPYSALYLNNVDFDTFIHFKYHCQHADKSGFIKKGELQRIAIKSGVPVKTLYLQFSKFKKLGWIIKTNDGHRILSMSTVNRIHNLRLKTNKTEGFAFTPFFKVSGNRINDLEPIKMYYLINDRINKVNHHEKANNKADKSFSKNSTKINKKKTITADQNGFKISIDRIRELGNYRSNATVDKIIKESQRLGLLIQKKNGYNDQTARFNCNEYFLNKFHWSELTNNNLVLNLVGTKKKKSIVTKRTKQTVKPLTPSEFKFKQFIDDHLIELVDNKIIDSKYLTRKVSRLSYNKILTKCLKDVEFKNLVLGYLNPNEVQANFKYLTNRYISVNYFESLPKYYDDDNEYGVVVKFRLGESNFNLTTLESKINYKGDLLNIDLEDKPLYSIYHDQQLITNNRLSAL